MITLTRREARCLHGVFRRSLLGIGHKGLIPPLVIRTEGPELRAQYRYGSLAVEHVLTVEARPSTILAVPLDALALCEGRDSTPVVVEAVDLEHTTVRWEDHGIPQAREFTVPPIDELAPFPEPPESWLPCSPTFLDALAEAFETGSTDTTRYALDCIQLRDVGGGHEIVATDGCQLLMKGGYRFPWEGNLLIRRSPVFRSKALLRDRPLLVGRTDMHVVLRTGPWTFFLWIVTGFRFPDVARVLQDGGVPKTRLLLDPEDARFLLPALDRLPGADASNAPVTLDLNGQVAIRACASNGSPLTELVLSRSGYTGAPTRLSINRAYLSRALRLGFREVTSTDVESPVVCRDGRRAYAWQPLSHESAIAAADNVTRIESRPSNPCPTPETGVTTKVEIDMNERNNRTDQQVLPPVPSHSVEQDPVSVPTVPGSGPTLNGLIVEAEAFHTALGEVRARAGRLTVALRRYRKRERLMATTLAALEQLKLPAVTA